MGSKELAVASRNLNHSHNSARLVPYGLLQVSIQVKQQALVYLLCCYQHMLCSVVGQRTDRIAFLKLMCFNLIYFHSSLLICNCSVPDQLPNLLDIPRFPFLEIHRPSAPGHLRP